MEEEKEDLVPTKENLDIFGNTAVRKVDKL